MDNRTLTAIVLAVVIWYGWLLAFPPPVPPDPAVDDGVVAAAGTGSVEASPASPAAPVAAPVEDVSFDACGAAATVTTEDGGLHDLTLVGVTDRYAMEPLWKWALEGFSGPWRPYGSEPGPVVLLGPDAHALVAGAGSLSARGPRVTAERQPDGALVTRGVTEDGIEITRTLRSTSASAPCTLDAEVSWRNTSDRTYTGGLWLGIHDVLPESSGRYDAPPRPWAMVDGSVEQADDLSELDRPVEAGEDVAWFGLADTYFAFLAVPRAADAGRVAFTSRLDPDGTLGYGAHWVSDAALAPGAVAAARFQVFVGMKTTEALATVDDALVEAVDLGFLSAFAWPLLQFLKLLHGLLGDWAAAIIGLTFTIKLVFFPLTQRSFVSSQQMQAIQPELKGLQEQFKDNPEELNRRTIALFQERGVNPVGGCLPMLLQMPVWFALYSVLLSSVELYHTEFFVLRDLTAPDPYLVLPTMVMGLMVVQQQLTPMGNMDPAQQRIMKAMPIIFGFFFYTLPAGLVLYIFVNMLLSILQQWYIKRTFSGQGPQVPAAGGA